MRYYRIVITDPNSGTVYTPPGFGSLLGGASYTNFVNGLILPGAWNVELDIPVVSFDLPMGGARVAVWGISLAEINQAANLAGKNIQVFAGMQKGLPLANPKQAGLIAQGFIFQAFGNWRNTEQTLELIMYPGSSPNGTGTVAQPKNIVLNWLAGTPLSQALDTALATAFPGFTRTINISPNLVRPNDDPGYHGTVTELGQYVRQASKSIIKDPAYAGVRIVLNQKAFNVFDGTVKQASVVKQIEYQDLIGQPTWIEAPAIQFATVMRSGINVGDEIKLPNTLVTNTVAAQSSLVNQRVNFQGTFNITRERHVGNSREPDASSWVTVFDAVPANPS